MRNNLKENNHSISQQAVGQNESHLTLLSENLAIHRDMKASWQEMKNHARQAGFELAIASGYRSFDRQLSIWNRKFNGELAVRDKDNKVIKIQHLSDLEKVMAILTFSALPGASRHHWGTDIDVYAPNLLPPNQSLQLEPWEYQDQGYFFPLSQWLIENVSKFGFFFPYQDDQGGVAVEPWHLSFSPLAQQYEEALTLPLLSQTIEEEDLAGKDVILANLSMIFKQYITNINNDINRKNYG
ncbi:M15 family metallopeptidase [Thalassotalea piscium]